MIGENMKRKVRTAAIFFIFHLVFRGDLSHYIFAEHNWSKQENRRYLLTKNMPKKCNDSREICYHPTRDSFTLNMWIYNVWGTLQIWKDERNTSCETRHFSCCFWKWKSPGPLAAKMYFDQCPHAIYLPFPLPEVFSSITLKCPSFSVNSLFFKTRNISSCIYNDGTFIKYSLSSTSALYLKLTLVLVVQNWSSSNFQLLPIFHQTSSTIGIWNSIYC